MADGEVRNMVKPSDGALLFANVVFSVVPSESLKEDAARELATTLKENGAEECPLDPSTGNVRIGEVTHIVSSTSDFPSYHAAADAFIPVARPEWVFKSLSKKRLAQVRQYSPDPRLFFSGVTVCCADLPSGDSDAIAGGVVAMGGQYSDVLTKLVTHIIALTQDSDKCQKASAKGLQCKIVLPHWFDDCLKLGTCIDERPYTLPNPEIAHASPDLPTPKQTPSPLRQDCKVFAGKKVMLCNDLGLGSRLHGTIEDLIDGGGGSVTGSVHRADVVVCRYRTGSDYAMASRAGKDVGSLTWLYHLIAHDVWTSPTRRLLHYPVARSGLPGFKDYRISLSNYGGEARLYLENLVWAAGGEFTKTMRQENTHLITARPQGEKCAAAKDWNIHMVNHLWLEESYAKWEVQSLSNPRYSHFAARIGLEEAVGQTEIDLEAVRSKFAGKDDDPDPTDGVMQGRDRNASSSFQASSGAPRELAKIQQPESPAVDGRTPKASRARGGRDASRAPTTPSRLGIDGKENDRPPTIGSRGAKDRAAARLHELAPDIALYEKERRRVGGVIRGGRRKSDEATATTGTKRSVSLQTEDDGSDMDVDGERDNKRQKKTIARPPVTMRLLLTGYGRLVEQPKTEKVDKKRLRDLGILIVDDPSHCTHLAAPSMLRTQKFLSALAYVPMVISTDFVDACLAEDALQDAEDFILEDVETEARKGFKLQDVLSRAKANKRRLLDGIAIYCTPTIHGGFDTYRAIVDANGGRCLAFKARHSFVFPNSKDEDEDEKMDEAGHLESVYLLSGETAEEKALWDKFARVAREHGKDPRIVQTEWLLDLAMSQELRWEERYELGV
ncbi:MAG: hypothetical protein M1832_004914 [Thelocarpon impressellum]|nr:MAG: hypothetical protein M1832_004914 [Thelocarpon impressellum]